MESCWIDDLIYSIVTEAVDPYTKKIIWNILFPSIRETVFEWLYVHTNWI